MNNADVLQELSKCETDLLQVQTIITGLGLTSNIAPYLTKYAVIRACGCIEISFKTVIADYCSYRSKSQVKRFLHRRIREGSANPTIDNIKKFLHDFDVNWKASFKTMLDQEPSKANLLTSLQSLVDARNNFAHGGNPSASISDVISYFTHARRIIEIMDAVVT